MIEDLELRSLFKTESEEHLTHSGGRAAASGEPAQPIARRCRRCFGEPTASKVAQQCWACITSSRLAHGLEDVLNAARQGKAVLSSEAIDQLCKQLDTMRQLVDDVVSDAPLTQRSPTPSAAQRHRGRRCPLCVPSCQIIPEAEREAASDHLETERGAGSPNASASTPRCTSLYSCDDFSPSASELAPTAALEAPSGRYRVETMRVEPQKLDMLMKHVSELTVAKIRIARRLTQIEELVTLGEEWAREIFAAHRSRRTEPNGNEGRTAAHHLAALFQRDRERIERLGALVNDLRNMAYEDSARLDSVVSTLEEGIRNIRLLPLATIFQLFPRMVRDLARDQAKEVQLIIEGGDITADKRILEEMKDPLMHMIRNSIDHGLESPAERQRCGKPRLGTIRLRARITPSNLVIEVADDGRGLDLERIKDTALKRRLRRAEELAAMTPAQIQSLIFAPGFSTSPHSHRYVRQRGRPGCGGGQRRAAQREYSGRVLPRPWVHLLHLSPEGSGNHARAHCHGGSKTIRVAYRIRVHDTSGVTAGDFPHRGHGHPAWWMENPSPWPICRHCSTSHPRV